MISKKIKLIKESFDEEKVEKAADWLPFLPSGQYYREIMGSGDHGVGDGDHF